jgi:hypothetical protein
MRPGVLAGLVFFSASAACAQSVAFSDKPPGIRLPSADQFAGAMARDRADVPPLDNDAGHFRYTPSSREFGIGPLRADTAGMSGIGHRPGVKPHFRLDGVSVLGGSISGSMDGRGGMLSLHWGGND